MGVASGRQARRPRRERHRVAPAVTHLGVSRCIFGAKAFGPVMLRDYRPSTCKKGYDLHVLSCLGQRCHEHASHHSVVGRSDRGGVSPYGTFLWCVRNCAIPLALAKAWLAAGGGVDSAESPGMEACELLIRACEPWSPARLRTTPSSLRRPAPEPSNYCASDTMPLRTSRLCSTAG